MLVRYSLLLEATEPAPLRDRMAARPLESARGTERSALAACWVPWAASGCSMTLPSAFFLRKNADLEGKEEADSALSFRSTMRGPQLGHVPPTCLGFV